MSQWAEIRHLHLVDGVPKKEIARRLKLDVKTVRRAVDRQTARVRVSPQRANSLDPWREQIMQWLREDRRTTAKRIRRLLLPLAGPMSPRTVRRYVAALRAAVTSKSKEAFVHRSVLPGTTMEVDFGESWADIAGAPCKVKYLVATLPYSNMYFAKAYPVERLESLLDGIESAFSYLGGIVDRVVLDNTSLAVKDVLAGRDRVQTEAFEGFRGASAVRRHDVVNMSGEAIVLLGASDRYAQALHRWMRGRRRASRRRSRCSTPRSHSTPRGAGCGRRCRRWRSGCAAPSRRSPATRPRPAPTYASDVEGWLKLIGYAGDAAATARALRCRAVDSLTEGGETLAAAQVLVAVKPPDLARLGRLREVQGRLEDAAETFEVADMPGDALRNWHAAGKWQQAVRLADGQERSDLEWLVELDTLGPAPARGSGQAPDRQRARVPRPDCWTPVRAPPQKRQDRSRCFGVAARHPAVARPRAPARVPRGRRHASGPGQGAHRPVLRPPRDGVPELDARLQRPVRLTDEQLALLWQAEFPNSRTRYTMKSVRTVRNLFNQGRRNNDRPRTPLPQYDPAGNPVLDLPYF